MKRPIDYFRAGINFGCWLESYPNDEQMLRGWITESDFAQAKSFGFDHIRLPFSYEILEKNIERLDFSLKMCEKHGLNLVLDLHKAPGYSFANVDRGLPNPFLDDPAYQKQFFNIWETLAKRYISVRENLAFEILNEVVEGPSARWNRIASEAIRSIREIDASRAVIYGGIHYNAVWFMNEMEVTDDPNIIYNFHFYEPHLFTHQHSWTPVSKEYNRPLFYPGEFPEHDRDLSRESMSADFDPVREFKAAHPNAGIYCGEYGVIRTAAPASKRNWLRDATDFFLELGAGRALWDYLDGKREWFACVHMDSRKPIDEEVFEITSKR